MALDWHTGNAGNITGGRRESFTFSGQVGLEIDLYFDKLAGLKGPATTPARCGKAMVAAAT